MSQGHKKKLLVQLKKYNIGRVWRLFTKLCRGSEKNKTKTKTKKKKKQGRGNSPWLVTIEIGLKGHWQGTWLNYRRQD